MDKAKIQAKIQALRERYDEIKELPDDEYTEEIRTERFDIVKQIKALNEDLKVMEDGDRLFDDLSQPEAKDPLFGPQNAEPKKPVIESREKHEYRNFGEQLHDVYTVSNVNAMSDNRMKAAKRLEEISNSAGMNESVASDGGFLVQEDYTSTLLKRAYETGMLVKECTKLPISAASNSAKIPRIDETSRVDGSRWGGVRAYWEGEGETLTASRPKFGELDLKLKKLTGLCYATDEMLQDVPLLGSYISLAFQEEFGFKFDDAIFRGTGAGQPLGIISAGCLISQAKESGQTVDTVVAENIEKMFSRMDPRSMARAKWYINQEVWPQIFQLHHAVGTGGVPMYVEPGKFADAPNGSLLGRPIEVIEQCSAIGDVGDIVFADLSRYLWADKGGIQSAASIHVRFVYDETAFRFIVRVDGQPMYKAALTPYKGTSTISPFVALAAR